jgi:competence protein ComEA
VCGCHSGAQVSVETAAAMRAEDTQADSADTFDVEETDEIYVYVMGKVKNPDVYKVPEDYRIYQVIELAGGFLEEAETGNINLADKLYDGMQIRVYAIGEETVQEYESVYAGNTLVNINTASKEELMSLPGIGEAKAESIITYRKENGRFDSIEDIMKISGIKEGAFNKIKDYITV